MASIATPPVQLSSLSNQLLDFTRKLDIDLLDNVVGCMHSGYGIQQRTAQDVLTTLKDHPDAWTRVDTILQFSTNSETKYFALQILETVITTRWKILPRTQCEGIKKFIVGLIIKTSSESDSLDKQKVYIGKLNMILVQILKYEWPNKWPNFISEIVGASKTNESLCQNNMVIMKLLSEELFDFSSGKLTQAKAKHLKSAMCKEFSSIFTLSIFVLENSQNAQLVSVTLETLLRFLNWIPLGYIYETKLISTLSCKFLNVPLFTNVTLMCLTEIASVKVNQYDEQFLQLFSLVMSKLKEMLPLSTNIREAYKQGRGEEQTFIQNLSLFLCQYLRVHGELIENSAEHSPLLFEALHYLILISEVDDIEIFKICLEYWCVLASDLYSYHETNYNDSSMLITKMPLNDEPKTRRIIYRDVLSKLRHVMISRMAKPEEVLVVENDQGEVVREFLKDTDSISMYKNMRETLVYLTHLDYADTELIMTEKLHNQVNGTEWSWKNLNTLCWAIGSISGAFHEEDEKRFLVMVIKDLLGLCEQKRGKDNKAIIASNIMYVVGQYPRFLRAHWRFLRTVVNKLFEFMHETHDGVQDMACDTFIKISQKCRRHFVQVQVGEMMPFIEEILNTISSIICDLNQQQVHTFYEAVGIMISAQLDTVTLNKLIEKYMMLPNSVWDNIIKQATADVQILKDLETVKQLSNIIKTNIRACKSLNNNYVSQLGRIYLDMLNVYKVMSENLNQAIKANGESITKQPLLKAMRTVRKDILKLMSLYITQSADTQMVQDSFLAPLLETVLVDYKDSSSCAREHEVLIILRTIIDRLKSVCNDNIPLMFNSVFECTLNMINKDFQEYPDHRTNFYLLIKSANQYCFKAILELPSATFKLLFDSIIWSIKHTMRDVAETGLAILYKLLQNMDAEDNYQQQFYMSYYTEILQHIFSVVTDSSHKAGLNMQSLILSHMFNLLDTNKIKICLGHCTIPDQNQPYIQDFLANLLATAFPHLNSSQIKLFIEGLFSFDQDLTAFKEHLRDFLVQIREFSGEDNTDLFLEEKEAEIKQAQLAKRTQQLAVPGIVGPHEDEMIDT